MELADGGRRMDCAACVILNGAREVLIARRRAEDTLGGFWEFPGGRLKPGETVSACAVRETREETGLAVRPERLIGTVERPDDGRERLRLHFVLCRASEGEARPYESEEVRWVQPRRLGQYRFPSANETIIAWLVKYSASDFSG